MFTIVFIDLVVSYLPSLPLSISHLFISLFSCPFTVPTFILPFLLPSPFFPFFSHLLSSLDGASKGETVERE